MVMNKVRNTFGAIILILACCSSAMASNTRNAEADHLQSSDHTKQWALPPSSDTLAGVSQLSLFPTLDQWVSTSIGSDSWAGSAVMPKQTIGSAVSQCVAAGASETSLCTIHLNSEYYLYCGPLPAGIVIKGIKGASGFYDQPTHVYCNTGSPAPISVAFGVPGGDSYLVDIDDEDMSGNRSGYVVSSQLSTTNGFSELNLSGATIGGITWSGVGANNDFLEVYDRSSIRGTVTLDSIGIDYDYSNSTGTWAVADTAGNGGSYLNAAYSRFAGSHTFTSTVGGIGVSYNFTGTGGLSASLDGAGANVFYDPNSRPNSLSTTSGAVDNGGRFTIAGNAGAILSLNDAGGNSNVTLQFQNNGTPTFSLFSGNGGYFSFYDNTTNLAYLTLDTTDDLTVNNLSSSTSSALTINQNANVGGPAAPGVVINDNETLNFPNLELNDTSGAGFASLYFANAGAGGVTLGQGSSFGQLFSIFDNTSNAAAMWFDLSDNSIFQNAAVSTASAMTVTQNSTTNGTALTLNVSGASPAGPSTPTFSVFGPSGQNLNFYDTGSFGGQGMTWSGTPLFYADGNFGGELVFPSASLLVSFAAHVTFSSLINITPQAAAVTPTSPNAGDIAITSLFTMCIYTGSSWVDVTPAHAACTF